MSSEAMALPKAAIATEARIGREATWRGLANLPLGARVYERR